MKRFSQRILVVLAGVVCFGVITTSGLVLYARHAIQRGARWQGFSMQEKGLALEFLCEPASGVRRAFFFVKPWAHVELEKILTHGSP